VAPGATYTRSEDPSPEALAHPHVPLRRFGTPAEIGAAVAFLLSQQAAYITGQVLYVDGGITAQISLPGIWV